MLVSPKSATRRDFLRDTAAIGAGLGLGLAPWQYATAADPFPEHNLKAVIPTAAGGASDRLARTFCDVWSKHIGAPTEFKFYPGAAGPVSYTHLRAHETDSYLVCRLLL